VTGTKFCVAKCPSGNQTRGLTHSIFAHYQTHKLHWLSAASTFKGDMQWFFTKLTKSSF